MKMKYISVSEIYFCVQFLLWFSAQKEGELQIRRKGSSSTIFLFVSCCSVHRFVFVLGVREVSPAPCSSASGSLGFLHPGQMPGQLPWWWQQARELVSFPSGRRSIGCVWIQQCPLSNQSQLLGFFSCLGPIKYARSFFSGAVGGRWMEPHQKIWWLQFKIIKHGPFYVRITWIHKSWSGGCSGK